MTLLPISGNANIDRGPLYLFTATCLPIGSTLGPDAGTATWVRLPSCFGSKSRAKTEMLLESVLARRPLWPNANYVERNAQGKIVLSPGRKPICQEIMINLVTHGKKMQYTNPNDPLPLTLAGCHPGWDDYLDLGETVNEMSHRLIAEDAQKGTEAPAVGATPQQEGASFIAPIPPPGSVMVSAVAFPGDQTTGMTCPPPVGALGRTQM